MLKWLISTRTAFLFQTRKSKKTSSRHFLPVCLTVCFFMVILNTVWVHSAKLKVLKFGWAQPQNAIIFKGHSLRSQILQLLQFSEVTIIAFCNFPYFWGKKKPNFLGHNINEKEYIINFFFHISYFYSPLTSFFQSSSKFSAALKTKSQYRQKAVFHISSSMENRELAVNTFGTFMLCAQKIDTQTTFDSPTNKFIK